MKNPFPAETLTFQAPGRVNLIGEHTDYNDGFVMPAAIGFYTRASMTLRPDRQFVVHSANYSEQREFAMDNLPRKKTDHWTDYVIGIARTLIQAGIDLPGANLLIDGQVPLGTGLSSSASLEVAVASAWLALAGKSTDKVQLAKWCQQAENEFVGARCGIMDQFISIHGKANHALLLDCRSLEYRLLPLPPEVQLVICNTMVRHQIADGQYNKRREECEAGVRALSAIFPEIHALRDVPDVRMLAATDLPELILRRCRHVVSENHRVWQAAGALQRQDLTEFGRLMNQSHESLRDDYEVSCPELDLMVAIAQQADGVYGARMTGGGFGGCTINLVQASCAESFREFVHATYENETDRQPEIYICSAAEGAGRDP
jgi:galactokinase